MQTLIPFISLPSWLQIVIWSLFGVLTGSLITGIVRTVTTDAFRAEHNDEIGVVVAVVGVFYGLVVTALLVQAVTHFNDAKNTVEREANLVDSAVRHAKFTSPELGAQIQDTAVTYLDQTIHREWPQQSIGKNNGISTGMLDRLASIALRYDPPDDKSRVSYSALLTDIDQLYASRKERSFRMNMEISPELWGVSLVGEVVLVALAMLMHIRNRVMHVAMAGATSVSISMVFALILIFDTPFAGDISISPEPYEAVWLRLRDQNPILQESPHAEIVENPGHPHLPRHHSVRIR